MSLTKVWVSGGGGGSGRQASSGEVLKTGYIKKLKTMKKKFFVLRAESGESPSCLEYYDSEKKWKANQAPKRVIALKSCFNINRRWDLKQRFVVALYTKDDCFCLALDSEEEADQWLSALLSTQRGGDDSLEGEPPKPTFERVWQVQVQKKGLGSSRNIQGPYMLCLTSHSLTLVRNGTGTPTTTSSSGQSNINDILNDNVEFSLSTIRRCGYSDCFFYMEVGRSSVTGAGELWMQTEDTNIAQNMHYAILHAMSRYGSAASQKVEKEADLGPNLRSRSSSANEASRPVSVLQIGSRLRSIHQYMPANSNAPLGSISAPSQTAVGGTWRPQALPHPHSQHTSQQQRFGGWVGGGQRVHHAPITHQQAASASSPSQRRHSVSGTGSRERCDSLPSRARTISEGPPSSSLPTSHHPSPPTACSPSSIHHHHHHVVHHIHPLHHPSMGSGTGSQHGQHGIIIRSFQLVPSGSTIAGGRPHSMYSRGLSYSPPIISSPVSPASGACSTTDSAGSSLSMEEGEGWCGSNGGMGMQEVGEIGYGGSTGTSHGPRYGHSLTPDEPAILEENVDDEYMPWGPGEALEMEEEEIAAADAEDGDEKLKNGGEEEVDEVDGVMNAMRKFSKKGRARNPGDYVPMGAVRSKTFPSPNHPTPTPTPHVVTPSVPSAPVSHLSSLSLPIQPVSLRPSPLHKTPPSGHPRSQQGFKSGSPSSQVNEI
ncbi:hypothetical protein J437_LFUL018592 [Ladona fulva]|uniref:Insulin receptor substrate 1 n=1 Tax=Ladona fulva TaxID=123851 RepID=A0A8K0KRR1_LADFU|nr:hypothetical protein J437_LFUL018592 [Ladona fulva]